eukprot:6213839-Pleurochrysis_carterae.AAC.2
MIWIRRFPNAPHGRGSLALPRAVHDSGGGRCCGNVRRVKRMRHFRLVVARRFRLGRGFRVRGAQA